jgi:hypothetical protein
MSPALASHHAGVARDDRAPELLVVGHVAIVERPMKNQGWVATLLK